MRISDWSSDVCSSDLSGLARHEQADVVVELIGGSDGPALTLARETLKQGRHFVTANKAMIAHHGLELARAAETTNAALKFRSEEHTSELQSLMRNSYAVFCLKKKIKHYSQIQQPH